MSRWVLLVLVGLPYVAVWIGAAAEVVRRGDLGAGRTVLWLAGLVFLPVLGLAAYVVVRPPRTAPIGEDAGWPPGATRLVLLAERRQRGEMSDDEYHAAVAGLRSP